MEGQIGVAYTRFSRRPCSIVRIPRSFHPLFIPSSQVPYLRRPMPSLAHTPLLLLLRGGMAVSEQALPLQGADRGLI